MREKLQNLLIPIIFAFPLALVADQEGIEINSADVIPDCDGETNHSNESNLYLLNTFIECNPNDEDEKKSTGVAK